MGCSGSKGRAAPMADTRPDPENEAPAVDRVEAVASPAMQEVSAAIPEEHDAQKEIEEQTVPAEVQFVEDTQEEETLAQPTADSAVQPETDTLPELVKSLDRDTQADDGETVTTAPKEDDSVVPGTEDKLEDVRDFPLCNFCRGW